MLPNSIQLISQAIKDRRCIAIRYHDQRQIRVIEPHAIYTDDRGELVLDGYQTRGFSASGRPAPFWRPFRLKKIMAVSVLKEAFQPRLAEGFSANRLKYRSGLVAIVQDTPPAFDYVYPSQTTEIGPHLPDGLRR
jgi:predicted DNA-binding transcriptional regulator YafY